MLIAPPNSVLAMTIYDGYNFVMFGRALVVLWAIWLGQDRDVFQGNVHE